MGPQDILDKKREIIHDRAGDDSDPWFYENRFVYARLQLDDAVFSSFGISVVSAYNFCCNSEYTLDLGIESKGRPFVWRIKSS